MEQKGNVKDTTISLEGRGEKSLGKKGREGGMRERRELKEGRESEWRKRGRRMNGGGERGAEWVSE